MLSKFALITILALDFALWAGSTVISRRGVSIPLRKNLPPTNTTVSLSKRDRNHAQDLLTPELRRSDHGIGKRDTSEVTVDNGIFQYTVDVSHKVTARCSF